MNMQDQDHNECYDANLEVEEWNPSALSILCVFAAFLWVGLAALYQTCQSIAWAWNLITGGVQ